MNRGTPRDYAGALERARPRLNGPGERFAGYGVVGLSFTLGHVLALRRHVASSIGPPHTSVWHRTPEGCWTFYVDVEPSRSCPRYFGAALHDVVRSEIELVWTGPGTLAISIPCRQLEWAIRLESSPRTRILQAAGGALPARALRSSAFLDRWGRTAGRLLQAGPLRLTGHTPNGQRFAMSPRRVWTIAASAAVVRGRDAGPLGPLPGPLTLGDYRFPDRGLFAAGRTWYEAYDPARHASPEPGWRCDARAARKA